ncbi:MAG: copper resistance CopC family protein [Candidatus Puniceispirillaceae bacterium]
MTQVRSLLLLLMMLALPPAAMMAHAHSPLLSTSPGDGSVVAAAPDAIEMNFRGKAQLIRFTLTRAGGEGVMLGKDHMKVKASFHRISLPSIGGGEFTAAWRAMSEDGHVLKGTFSFTVKGD